MLPYLIARYLHQFQQTLRSLKAQLSRTKLYLYSYCLSFYIRLLQLTLSVAAISQISRMAIRSLLLQLWYGRGILHG